MYQNFVFFFVALAACASIGSALQCYECMESSATLAPSCRDPFAGRAPSKTCHYDEVCIKYSTPEVTLSSTLVAPMTYRGCEEESYCEKMETIMGTCEACSSDLCNSSVTIFPSFITMMILSIVKLIFL